MEDDTNKFRIRYELEIDLGTFLEEYPRKIWKENLYVNGEPVFLRGESLHLMNLKMLKGYLSDVTEQNRTGIEEIMTNSLNSEELFLTNGFKLVIIYEHFDGQLGKLENKPVSIIFV